MLSAVVGGISAFMGWCLAKLFEVYGVPALHAFFVETCGISEAWFGAGILLAAFSLMNVSLWMLWKRRNLEDDFSSRKTWFSYVLVAFSCMGGVLTLWASDYVAKVFLTHP